MSQKVVICNDIVQSLNEYLSSGNYDRLYILTDTHTHKECLPLIRQVPAVNEAMQIVIEAGDTHKNIEQLNKVWKVLSENGATRNSLLINLGGGMVTDLGGFAGATFKRGLHTLNIPTTLMASVDAAVGGKTGINFNGLKNEIGSFYIPDCVLIDSIFLQTLDQDNLLSGYAEMIKHGLIDSTKAFTNILSFDPNVNNLDLKKLNELVKESVAIKEHIVEEDPKEMGIRKALNFGHTIGHAFESLSFSINNPLLHGHAVAAGMISELYLSYKSCNMPVEILRQTTNFVKKHYPSFVFGCDDYETIYTLMMHDKKNEGDRINFTLLGNIGDIRINQEVSKELVLESLDFYRENFC